MSQIFDPNFELIYLRVCTWRYLLITYWQFKDLLAFIFTFFFLTFIIRILQLYPFVNSISLMYISSIFLFYLFFPCPVAPLTFWFSLGLYHLIIGRQVILITSALTLSCRTIGTNSNFIFTNMMLDARLTIQLTFATSLICAVCSNLCQCSWVLCSITSVHLADLLTFGSPLIIFQSL